MRNIKFEYDHSIELENLIESVYFLNNNNGKLPEITKEHLLLNSDNLYYNVLSGLNYKVKIRNTELIDGSMEFNMVEHVDSIELVPTSKYCVKVMDTKSNREKYSFY